MIGVNSGVRVPQGGLGVDRWDQFSGAERSHQTSFIALPPPAVAIRSWIGFQQRPTVCHFGTNRYKWRIRSDRCLIAGQTFGGEVFPPLVVYWEQQFGSISLSRLLRAMSSVPPPSPNFDDMLLTPGMARAAHEPGNGSGVPLVQEETDSVRVPDDVPAGKILIVDDETANVMVARKLLTEAGHRNFETTTDARLAMNLVHTYQPDLVLLDINMPHIDGISILSQIRSVERFSHLPVLILTANTQTDVKLQCLELGATDFLVKPIDAMELAPRVRNALQYKQFHDQLMRHAEELERKVQQRTEELERSRREIIYCLARAAEMCDNDTGNHVIRVGRYAGIIAKNLGLPAQFVDDLELAAQLHDVGKIAIPDAILLKPGKLEPEEFDIVREHVKHGRQIIKPFGPNDASALRSHVDRGGDILSDSSSLMRLAASIAQTHHEKYDGTGYPIGLAGDDIPIEGRITAVADVFDALSSERPYKKAMPREKCFQIMEEGRGSHFDPKILDSFFKSSSEIVRVQVEFVDFPDRSAQQGRVYPTVSGPE